MPHTVVEGVIMACLLTEATQGFIYIRHEYPEQIEACRGGNPAGGKADRPLRSRTPGRSGGRCRVSVFVSPGGYICGEQSALIEAMSDRRGEPRNMPPKLETNGLEDLPTLVSNVETFAWSPFICIKGGKTYADLGVNGWKGRRFSRSPATSERPGVYEVPMGMTLRELIEGEEYCQGMVGGRKLKAFAPSGPSGGFLPAPSSEAPDGLPRNHTNNKILAGARRPAGLRAGRGRTRHPRPRTGTQPVPRAQPHGGARRGAGRVRRNPRHGRRGRAKSLEFFRNESCGKCVPCRIGSQKLDLVGREPAGGTEFPPSAGKRELGPLVKELGATIGLASICGLGRSVPMPLTTVMRTFPEDVAKHLGDERRQRSNAEPTAPTKKNDEPGTLGRAADPGRRRGSFRPRHRRATRASWTRRRRRTSTRRSR